MKNSGLNADEVHQIKETLSYFPEINKVILYGSRAKGNYRPESDIDLALIGCIDSLKAEAVAVTLDELPLPYHFDVIVYEAIKNHALREHIDRVGIALYQREI